MKVMIVVTHLLGSGHLSRALTLGKAFEAEGHRVTLVSGGQPVAHLGTAQLDFVQLLPLRSDGTNFTTLLDDQGMPVSDDYLSSRTNALVDTLRATQPDVLITELFPFGRRILSAEFLTLLKATRETRTQPLVLASVRDILAPPSSTKKADRTTQIVLDYYNGVLVHSVEAMVPLSISWPVSKALAAKLHYTGFVAPPVQKLRKGEAPTGDILVSAGGGAVGDNVFEAAIDAANLDAAHHWRILVGGANPEARIAALNARVTKARITIEPARPDFRTLLGHAACSISLCGYNTALDVLQTSTPALFIPFDDGGEVEQTLRAESLAKQAGIGMLKSSDLSGPAILQQLDTLVGRSRSPLPDDQFDGGKTTVEIVTNMITRR